jgi:hypothetical protein
MLRAGRIKGEGAVVSGVKTKLEPLLLIHLTLTIIENRSKMRKIQLPQSKGVKNFKKQTTKHYKSQFSNTKKNSFYVALLL